MYFLTKCNENYTIKMIESSTKYYQMGKKKKLKTKYKTNVKNKNEFSQKFITCKIYATCQYIKI